MGFIPAGTLAEWMERVRARTARVGIVGLGYVGLPLTLLLSEDGFAVLGFDTDASKVETLNAGGSYIHRILPEHVRAAQGVGFRATTDFGEAANLDAILICVPTPLYPDHTPDMRAVEATMAALAPHVRAGQLVVLESTTYPGTTEELVVGAIEGVGTRVMGGVERIPPIPIGPEWMGHTAIQPGLRVDVSPELDGVMVAFSPEREDPGNVTTPRRTIPKVVGGVGGQGWMCDGGGVCAVWRGVRADGGDVDAGGGRDDEAARKHLSEREHRAGERAEAALPRDGDRYLGGDRGGGDEAVRVPGVPAGAGSRWALHSGGSVLPDVEGTTVWVCDAGFIELAGEMNESMPGYVVRTAERALERAGKTLRGAKVLVLGVAYKRMWTI